MLNGSHLRAGKARYLFYTHGLVVVNVTGADAGLYECQSVEKAGGREFRVTMAAYLLEPRGQEKGFVTSQHDQSTRRRAGSMLPKTKPGGPPKPGSPARQKQPQSIRGPLFTLMLLSTASTCLFLFLLSWNIYRGHCSLPWRLGKAEVMKSAGPEPSLELAWRSPATQSPACKSAPPGGFSGEGHGAEAPLGSRVRLACGAPNCLATEECLTHRDSRGA
ncbi:uncharacterized protein LOC123036642 [Varanus komodoensis]|uniref:uncharacterized protein LOC123036642 n=1 Tax=Varanus komodoensis TaxID=61221 RepID=UPI001CF77E74|nr:uncharacterized protein LOC123036642 [Varanus komodoensis]